jgi:hypothetical protein
MGCVAADGLARFSGLMDGNVGSVGGVMRDGLRSLLGLVRRDAGAMGGVMRYGLGSFSRFMGGDLRSVLGVLCCRLGSFCCFVTNLLAGVGCVVAGVLHILADGLGQASGRCKSKHPQRSCQKHVLCFHRAFLRVPSV